MAGVISDNRTEHGIPHTVSCRALSASESWFYKWRDRRPTGRELRRQRLADEIQKIFTESGGTYGSPKIFILLIRRAWRVSVNTVAKLMAELGLVARVVRRRGGLARRRGTGRPQRTSPSETSPPRNLTSSGRVK
ncbi:IS3 family transposase [Streptomyces lavendulae]|uniref:IS3 family transposase n=1 Tax=Streptomyces lavendulae TaxID=1914 RepID=UPI0031E6E364